MNQQAKANGGRGIEWTDYTWNPIAGCFHACQWEMPDGSIANCYAEDVAERSMAKQHYPEGFEHHYWKPQVLEEPLNQKKPSKIFCGSMADVFGHWVPEEQIKAVLDVARRAHWHTFQMLTKNPKRVLDFMFDIPKNVWIGASTPPSFMWNNKLDDHRRMRLMATTLGVLAQLRERGVTTWISAEPLNLDLGFVMWSNFVNYPGEGVPDWVVIGAASNGNKYFPPDEAMFKSTMQVLDANHVPVFFKGNMKSLSLAAENWREEFPYRLVEAAATPGREEG